jgi:ATP-dependent helicase HrpB
LPAPPTAPLPIDPLLPELRQALPEGATVLLQAPPGAGKTTRVPLALLGAIPGIAGLEGSLVMLEPRRLATRAAAARLADHLGEPVGERIGYAVRHEQKRSSRTRVEVVTAGLFLRRLQADPELEGIDCVVFDEFHERGRDSDLALALVRDARNLVRPDLRLVLMSATLDLGALASRLPNATLLTSEGRAYPVDTHHLPPRPQEPLNRTVLRALETHALPLLDSQPPAGLGAPTVLVFLPGLREIDQCRRLIDTSTSLEHWEVCSLHGQQSLERQAAALRPCPSRWAGRIVLATSIAESSLTLNGVRLVIDSGLSRRSRYDPGTGMEGLETVPASLASAEQRRGRAGRQAPGRCVRLWSPAEQQRRPAQDPPELLRTDPQPLVLDLALWGAGLGDRLTWLDPPAAPALREGRQQLIDLGVLEGNGLCSPLGRQLARLGTHPRLGLALLQARHWNCSPLGADLAALLSERDPLNPQDHGSDLGTRLHWLTDRNGERQSAVRKLSHQLLRQLDALPPLLSSGPLERWGDTPDTSSREELTALLLATAFPGWIALPRPSQPGRYLLRQGRGAQLPAHDPLQQAQALAVARLDLDGADARIRLALPLPMRWLHQLAQREGSWQESVRWDPEQQRVRGERCWRLGALTIGTPQSCQADDHQTVALLLERLQSDGLEVLPWGPRSEQLQKRLDLMQQHHGSPWPLRSWKHLAAHPAAWLTACLQGHHSWHSVQESELIHALWGDLPWELRQSLDHHLPEAITIPSGRRAHLQYREGEVCLAVKLQEMFGCRQGPRVLGDRVPVTLELLSPAGRPLQRTQDLEGFWHGSYRDVRREMRGRYPKHPWPEDPLTAVASARPQRHQRGDPS